MVNKYNGQLSRANSVFDKKSAGRLELKLNVALPLR
jgi:hypothetical protein